MIILLAGSSHTGKTVLAQKLLNKYGFPYLSQDHLKMGLIRSGFSTITPEDNIKDIMKVIWPITREIIKTCIENKLRENVFNFEKCKEENCDYILIDDKYEVDIML